MFHILCHYQGQLYKNVRGQHQNLQCLIVIH